MRIGLFTDQYYPFISGVVTSVKMLYEGLTALGHECFIFTSADEELVKNEEEYKNKNVINIPGRPYPFKSIKDYRYTFTHKKFIKIVKEYNLDIIHIHTEYNIAKLAMKSSKKLNIPVVHTLHTLWSDYIKYLFPFLDKHFHGFCMWLLRTMFTKKIGKVASYQIVPTKKVLQGAKDYSLGKNIEVIPTGIELNRFYSSNFTNKQIEELRNKLGIKEDQFVYLYVGRTSKEKDIPLLLEAFAKAHKDDSNKIFLLIGGGPELPELKEKAKTLEITNQVIFTDLIPWNDVPLYYQLGHVFLNASKSETQGLTYIEALSSSLPILVQKDECLDEVLEDYKNGIFFDGLDDLINKMNEINSNKELLASIKENTTKSVEKYSKEAYSKAILDIYNKAIEIYNSKNK